MLVAEWAEWGRILRKLGEMTSRLLTIRGPSRRVNEGERANGGVWWVWGSGVWVGAR